MATERKTLKVVFVGNPNTGKSTLINALAGSDLKISNWAGTTVEKVSALLRYRGYDVELVDLPGTYDILPNNLEEEITFKELLSEYDVIVNVIDTGHLERNLHVTLELAEMGRPMVVVLNMVDEAESRGYEVHPEVLEEVLGVPVITTVATKGIGVWEIPKAILKFAVPRPAVVYPEDIERAAREIERLIKRPEKRWMSLALLSGEWSPTDIPKEILNSVKDLRERFKGRDLFLEIESARFESARDIAQRVLRRRKEEASLDITDRVDRFVLHPVWGNVFFALLTLLVFRFTFLLSAPWVDYIGLVQEVLGGWVASLGLNPLLTSFLVEGVINGVGTVLSFAPVLFLLYLAISFLEMSGLLARAAFQLDALMRFAGLPGKAFVPLILGFGCNVPAVYSTRSLENFSERLKTALVIPFMNCSARLTVHVLFAAVFFPNVAPYMVMAMYFIGVLVAMLTALAMGRVVKSENAAVFELPPYRIPKASVILRQAYNRTMGFVEGAGGVILLAVVLVWLMVNFPSPEDNFLKLLSNWAVGVFSLIGINDWRLISSLIPGFIAKEVVIGSLAVSYLGGEPFQAVGLWEGLRALAEGFASALLGTLKGLIGMFWLPSLDLSASGGKLGEVLRGVLTPASAFAYMVFILLYTPCVATVSAIRQEFGNRWAALSIAYQITVAFAVSWLAYRLAVLVF